MQGRPRRLSSSRQIDIERVGGNVAVRVGDDRDQAARESLGLA